jgi:hypothetical protein
MEFVSIDYFTKDNIGFIKDTVKGVVIKSFIIVIAIIIRVFIANNYWFIAFIIIVDFID